MTGQAFITIPDRRLDERPDRVDPLAGANGLGADGARHIERQPDHDLRDVMLALESSNGGAVAGWVRAPPQRRQRKRPAIGVGEGDTDPSLPDVEPQQARHGTPDPAPDPADRDGRGDTLGRRDAAAEGELGGLDLVDAAAGVSSTVTSSRASMLVTVLAHDGQIATRTSPN